MSILLFGAYAIFGFLFFRQARERMRADFSQQLKILRLQQIRFDESLEGQR